MEELKHSKAKKFIAEAERHGWTSEWSYRADDKRTMVVATREGEVLSIWWYGNLLNESPVYAYAGRTVKTHNTAGAYRQLAATAVVKPARRIRINEAPNHEAFQGVPLPFHIEDTPRSAILHAIRDSTLTWRNGISGVLETAKVPYKIVSRGRVSTFNTDLKYTFYIRRGKDGRRYVSFMDENGLYRAVYLDAIVSVS